VDVPQVGAGNVKSTRDSDHFHFREIVDNRQGQEIVFHEEFQGPVQLVVGLKRPDVAPHQVLGQDQRTDVRRLGDEVNLLQVDHAEKPPARAAW